MTPYQLAEAKNKEQNAVVKSMYKEERDVEIIENAISKGFDDSIIAELTGLSLEKIQQIRAGKQS